MVTIRDILKPRTMKVLAQEQGRRCIKSKLYYFYKGFFVLTAADAFFITKYVFMTSQWRISWRKTRQAPHALSKKTYNFDFTQCCPRFCANTFIFLGFKILLILTIYGHLAVNWFPLISFNFTPFYPIEMGFSLEILFLRSKNVCKVLNTVFQIFNVVTKIGVTYDVILSRNVKNTFTMVKI